MGLTRSFMFVLAASCALLVGERVLTSSPMRDVCALVAAVALAAALFFDTVRVSSDVETRARRLRIASTSLIALAVLVYAAERANEVETSPLSLVAFLGPFAVGFFSRAAWERAERASPHDGARVFRHTRSAFVLSTAVVGLSLINAFVATHDRQIDVSFSPATEPSAHVASLIDKLDAPLEIVLFLDPSNDVWPAIRPYFEALRARSSKISLRLTEASREPDLLREYRIRGNGWGLLRIAKHGEVFEVGKDLSHARMMLKMLDAHVANHLSPLLTPARTVYLTRGHGERSPLGDVEESRGRKLSDFERLLIRFNLRLSSLGVLEGLARDVPNDAALVLVLGPEKAFLPEEAASLSRYVARGGKLWLGLEPGVDVGLDDVLQELGVATLKGAVACRESHLVRNRSVADRELVVSGKVFAHPITERIKQPGRRLGVILVRAVGMRADRAVEADVTRTLLIASNEDCFVDEDGDFEANAQEPLASIPLAISWERKSGARVLLVGDGDMPTDQVLRNDANTLVTLDALSWLIDTDAVMVPLLSEQEMPIVHRRDEDRAWFYASSFAMPAVLVFVAFLCARGRRRHTRA